MYSMQPVADYTNVHTGFFILSGIFIVAFACILELWKDDAIETITVLIWAAILSLLTYVVHENSYTINHPLNQEVVGEFVRFETEGYRERSGKQMVDRHYTYVVYRVGNSEILFPASPGLAYPPRAILYKN